MRTQLLTTKTQLIGVALCNLLAEPESESLHSYAER